MTFGSKDRFWFFLFLAAGAIIGGLLGNFLEASQFFWGWYGLFDP